ncbi:MAG: MerR family DNA-binding protein [Alphaproteobacteria bacterium]|nr:MerR family DNA-binding protein [Alphaproteobacteria bacterium]
MTIGDASEQSGVPVKTIRYYEQIGLINEASREPNLYRTYNAGDVAMLRFIGRARRLGFSIEDLRSLVALYRDRARSSRDVKMLASQHLTQIEQKIAELQSLRNALADLIKRCKGDHRPDCPIIDDLGGTSEPATEHPASQLRHTTSAALQAPHFD